MHLSGAVTGMVVKDLTILPSKKLIQMTKDLKWRTHKEIVARKSAKITYMCNVYFGLSVEEDREIDPMVCTDGLNQVHI